MNVAARGCGVALRAFELAVRYARSRRTFGKIIGEHQAISFKLAEMATRVTAAHQMMVMAARRKGRAGSPTRMRGCLRIHCAYGYFTEHEIERLYRDALMLLIGEGTAEIQKMITGRALVRDYDVRS